MASRADEAARIRYEQTADYLLPRPRDAGEDDRVRSREALQHIIHELGPVVDAYPTWHPLVCNHESHDFVAIPNNRCGYLGLDHTCYFTNGFITCPYGDGQDVLESVAALPSHPIATVTADRLDVQLYDRRSTPILVRCDWQKPLLNDGTIPLSIAVPLILEQEVPCWRWAEVAETWESMRSGLLGSPHGSRSSLFVNQETGQGIKKVWKTLINTGIFGPIKV